MRRVAVSGVYQCRELPLEFTVDGDDVRGPDHYTRTIETTEDWGHTVKIEKKRESTKWIKDKLRETA